MRAPCPAVPGPLRQTVPIEWCTASSSTRSACSSAPERKNSSRSSGISAKRAPPTASSLIVIALLACRATIGSACRISATGPRLASAMRIGHSVTAWPVRNSQAVCSPLIMRPRRIVWRGSS